MVAAMAAATAAQMGNKMAVLTARMTAGMTCFGVCLDVEEQREMIEAQAQAVFVGAVSRQCRQAGRHGVEAVLGPEGLELCLDLHVLLRWYMRVCAATRTQIRTHISQQTGME